MSRATDTFDPECLVRSVRDGSTHAATDGSEPAAVDVAVETNLFDGEGRGCLALCVAKRNVHGGAQTAAVVHRRHKLRARQNTRPFPIVGVAHVDLLNVM